MAEPSWMRRVPARGALTDIRAVENDIYVQPGRGDGSPDSTGSATRIAAARTALVALAVLGLAAIAALVLVTLDAHA
jgi:hypothetical protein